MKWNKKGLIFEPSAKYEWMQTHAALPIADLISDNRYKIYFSTRNSNNIASVGFLEIDLKNPKKIISLSNQPVLSSGDAGAFDDSGVMAHSLVNHMNKKYLFYTGWNRGISVPFRWSIGLAISEDGGKTFEKYSEGPILDRNPIDPYIVASPTVIKENDLWRMWYVSGIKWNTHDTQVRIPYHIRYAESKDGINWKRNGIISVDFNKTDETRIGRAAILKNENIYKMWYSYAVDKYRIGYATSSDGINWNRDDKAAGIEVSESGWDSQMIEYPFIFHHKDSVYMLYNGNNYGKTGFGYAILD